MCDECDAIPVQYVAYFNKAGGKLWRPAQKQATAWAIDIRPPETPAARAFACDEPAAQTRDVREENPRPVSSAHVPSVHVPAAPPSPNTGRDKVQDAREARDETVA
jgi:hypothetical protein